MPFAGNLATISSGTASTVPGVAPVTLTLATSTSSATTTNYDATWDAWNEVYTVTARYNGSMATQATLYALQAHLNAISYEAQMTGDTWTAWNVQYVANSILLTTANTAITTGTAANTATIVVANAWDDTWGEWVRVQDADNLTRDERIAREVAAGHANAELRERYQREQEARLKEELEAKEKAIVLLKSCLTKQQLEEYEKKKHFHLHVGEKVYRIEQGSHGNVKLVDKDGKVKRSFCIQPRGVPDGDAMLAQKLLLQTDEKAFYESANVTEYDKEGRHLGTFHGARAVDLLQRDAQRTG